MKRIHLLPLCFILLVSFHSALCQPCDGVEIPCPCSPFNSTCATDFSHAIYRDVAVAAGIIYAQSGNYKPGEGAKYTPIDYDTNTDEEQCIQIVDCIQEQSRFFYDVYYPEDYPWACGTLPPAIVLFHGGGNSECSDVSSMEDYAREFAERGFVVFNVEYRRGSVGALTCLSASSIMGIYRGVQDAKGAIRTIIKNNKTTVVSPYHFDPEQLFIGGSSAGAIIADATAYLSNDSWDALFGPQLSQALGSINYDHYKGQTSTEIKIKGVLSMWGAVLGLATQSLPTYINGDDPPFIGFHGLNDNTVFPDAHLHNFCNVNGAGTALQCENEAFPSISYTVPADGSIKLFGTNPIYDRCLVKDVCAEIYLDSDLGHGFLCPDLAGVNSVFGFDRYHVGLPDVESDFSFCQRIRSYMVGRACTFFQTVMKGDCQQLIKTNFPDCQNFRTGCYNYGDNNDCSTMPKLANENAGENFQIAWYQNTLTVASPDNRPFSTQVLNLEGKRMLEKNGSASPMEWDLNLLPAGMYLVRVTQDTEIQVKQIFKY